VPWRGGRRIPRGGNRLESGAEHLTENEERSLAVARSENVAEASARNKERSLDCARDDYKSKGKAKAETKTKTETKAKTKTVARATGKSLLPGCLRGGTWKGVRCCFVPLADEWRSGHENCRFLKGRNSRSDDRVWRAAPTFRGAFPASFRFFLRVVTSSNFSVTRIFRLQSQPTLKAFHPGAWRQP
jgi:hypothetical protein